jgi:hypothetical protein
MLFSDLQAFLAQTVERTALNRVVVGSIPTECAFLLLCLPRLCCREGSPDTHIALVLLRACGAFPLACFGLRAVGPCPAWLALDLALRSSAESLLGPLDDARGALQLSRRPWPSPFSAFCIRCPGGGSAFHDGALAHINCSRGTKARRPPPWVATKPVQPLLATTKRQSAIQRSHGLVGRRVTTGCVKVSVPRTNPMVELAKSRGCWREGSTTKVTRCPLSASTWVR